jgi:hypothetical protein
VRIPYATRYLVNEYRVVAEIVSDDKYLEMPEGTFIAECLKRSGGRMNPTRAKHVYLELMKDAGLPPLSSTKPRAEEIGDHSWEYYVDGKVVTEEEYNTAHSSYYAV